MKRRCVMYKKAMTDSEFKYVGSKKRSTYLH